MSAWRCYVLSLALATITLTGGCERQPRKREREAQAARADAHRRAEAARLEAERPLPEEPPFENLRVPRSGLPCAVDEVFASKCRRCHTIPPRHAAPLVFLTWDDTRQDRFGQPLYEVMGRAVRSDFMPYKIDANPKISPLTAAEKKIILDWVEAGAPRGDCDATSPAVSASAAPKPVAPR